jgi:uncharacterized membrane protein YadS
MNSRTLYRRAKVALIQLGIILLGIIVCGTYVVAVGMSDGVVAVMLIAAAMVLVVDRLVKTITLFVAANREWAEEFRDFIRRL